MDKSKISRDDFLKIDEKDVMFITNPGRMGDEDGCTFVINKDGKYITYRVNGWMYPKSNKEDFISLDDALNQFPKWHEAWDNCSNENYKGKYKYLYMGFGNGLCVDNSIYNEYEPYLSELVEMYLENHKESGEDLKYAAVYNVWQKAALKMIKEKRQ